MVWSNLSSNAVPMGPHSEPQAVFAAVELGFCVDPKNPSAQYVTDAFRLTVDELASIVSPKNITIYSIEVMIARTDYSKMHK